MCSGCGVTLLLLLCSICISFALRGDMISLAFGVSMAGGLTAATVGYVPTAFVCWGVGLVCRVSCLMAFCVLFYMCLIVEVQIIFICYKQIFCLVR